jgi:hypothetical protein
MINELGVGPVQKGSVMVLLGTQTPSSVPLAVKAYWKNWKLVGNSDAHDLDENLRRAGWNFFFVAGSVRGWTAGSGETAIRRTMQRVLGKVKSAEFNCLQIAEIRIARFLGIPYVKVEAFSRHIQRTNQMDTLKQRHRKIAEAAYSQR